jgi:uncharacterized membrane protein
MGFIVIIIKIIMFISHPEPNGTVAQGNSSFSKTLEYEKKASIL